MKKALLFQLPGCSISSFLLIFIAMFSLSSVAQVSITTTGTPVTQNFNTLTSSGTSSVLPAGWAFLETGTGANATYTAGNGSGNAGDTYSFGSLSSTERAFGSLRSGSVVPQIGASFTNNSPATVHSLTITYTGEQWRLGATGRTDVLTFAYSTNATSLTSGTYNNVTALNFTAPITTGTIGLLDGNLATNRTAISHTITGLSITPGSTFWIRWTDTDASGADDGMAIDDFSLTAFGTVVSLPTPDNDLCGDAENLIIPSNAVTGTLAYATFSSPFANNDVWYSFNATCNGLHTVTVTNFTGDVDIELYSGSCPLNTTSLYRSNSVSSTETISQTLSAGTYYLRVLAYNIAAESSDFTVSLSAICPCLPPSSAPSGLTFSGNTASSVSGSFTAASPEPTGGYLVVQSTSPTLSASPANGVNYATNALLGGGTVVANLPANGLANYAFNRSSLNSNSVYNYFVIPYNNESGVCSYAYGNAVTLSGGTLTCPSSPTGINVGSIAATSASVSWNPPSGVGTISSYNLQWKPSSSSTFNFSPNVTSPFQLNGLEANTSYDIQVNATNNVCAGNYSVVFSFTTASLSSPVALSATGVCNDQFTANWSSVDGASGYQLDVSTSPTFSSGSGTTTDLIISEYVEGSSNNKYLEIYNGTGSSVNLGNYRLRLFANGATTPNNDVLLSGTLANGATVVYRNSLATIYTGTTIPNTAINFNGDDAIGLFKVSTGTYVDIFGTIGEDPGNAWTSGTITTLDRTLVRKPSVTGGVTVNPSSGFPTLATEWDVYPQDEVSELGSHNTSSPSFVPGYQNLPVSSNSQLVDGLTTNTTYYYRIRTTSANSTSDNSNVVSVLLVGSISIESCPGSIILNNNADQCSSVVVYPDVIASGSPAPTVNYNIPSGSAFPLGTTTVIATASNGCATATCSFDVTVLDNQPPSISCPASQILALGAGCSASLPDYTRAAIVSDNCVEELDPSLPANQQNNNPSGITVTQLPPAGTMFNGTGVQLITLIATDSSGNTNSCQFNLLIQDLDEPVAACQDIVAYLDLAGNASISESAIDNGSNDNCGIESLSLSSNSFTCDHLGNNAVELIVEDVNGNTSSCSATVLVVDTVSPTAICQSIVVALNSDGFATINAEQIDFESHDACGVSGVSLSLTDFDCSNIGSNTVELTVSDASGNTSTCSATVLVQDNTPAVAVCKNAIAFLDAAGNVSVSANDVDNESNDVCGVVGLSVSPETFDCSKVGPNPVTLTVIDAGSNQSTCSASVLVIDTVAPIAICKDATVQLNALGKAYLTPTDINNGSSDACGLDGLFVSKEEFGCSDVGQHDVILFVFDVNGNASYCESVVFVQDKMPATPICQNITVNLDGDGNAEVNGSMLNNGSYDNCGIASLTSSSVNYSCSDIGNNTATLTVEDNSGNLSTCTSIVTVADNSAPAAICREVTVTLNGSGNATATAVDVNDGSYDNCGIQSINLSKTSFGCSDIGSNAVTLTVIDVNGLSSSCQANVKVVGALPTCAITAVPANNVYTGGVSTNIYLGYGSQSVTLQSSVTGGIPQSYSWTGAGLSCYQCPNPVFAPSTGGIYTFTLSVTNNFGCVTSCTITICVLDIRAGAGKVYLSHYPNGNAGCSGACNTISISTNAVPAHLAHPCDHLGACTGTQICGVSKTDNAEDMPLLESGNNVFDAFVFPNPFADVFRLRISSSSNEPVQIRVYDVLGQLIAEQKRNEPQSDISVGGNLSKGIYLLEVTQGTDMKVLRIIKSE